jgi:hypothetical protein
MFVNEEVEDKFLSRKWLILNEWIAYKKIVNFTNIIELRNIRIYLYKIKSKWENKIRNLSSELGSRTVVENSTSRVSYIRAVVLKNLVLGGHSFCIEISINISFNLSL